MNKLYILFFVAPVLFGATVLGSEKQPTDYDPKTFLIDESALRKNKYAIENWSDNEELKAALSELTKAADEAMTRGPYSVTFKKKVPPSGDKHDYMSVGPYWWPDPSKPDGLPYIRRDGEVNPERFDIQDAEMLKDLCNDVKLLSVAYYFTDNEKYAKKAVNLLRVWFIDEATRMNPHLKYGQAIPGITEGRGIGLIDTRAFAYLIDGIRILQHSVNMNIADDYALLRDWFTRFHEWMTTDPIGLDEARQHNNHGTYYDVQALSMLYFTADNEEVIEKLLNEQVKARIESQLEPDGRLPHELARTLSWNYSCMNLAGFFELAAMAEIVDIDLWNYVSPGGKSIKQAFLWMLPYAEGKTWEYKQIKPIDPVSFVNLARTASIKYPDIDLKSFLTKMQNKKSDYFFILTN